MLVLLLLALLRRGVAGCVAGETLLVALPEKAPPTPRSGPTPPSRRCRSTPPAAGADPKNTRPGCKRRGPRVSARGRCPPRRHARPQEREARKHGGAIAASTAIEGQSESIEKPLRRKTIFVLVYHDDAP